MNSIEKGMQMPEDITMSPDKLTKKLFKDVKGLDIYFTFLRKPNGSTVDLCTKYLKILN